MGRVQLIVHTPLGGSTGGVILPILWASDPTGRPRPRGSAAGG